MARGRSRSSRKRRKERDREERALRTEQAHRERDLVRQQVEANLNDTVQRLSQQLQLVCSEIEQLDTECKQLYDQQTADSCDATVYHSELVRQAERQLCARDVIRLITDRQLPCRQLPASQRPSSSAAAAAAKKTTPAAAAAAAAAAVESHNGAGQLNNYSRQLQLLYDKIGRVNERIGVDQLDLQHLQPLRAAMRQKDEQIDQLHQQMAIQRFMQEKDTFVMNHDYKKLEEQLKNELEDHRNQIYERAMDEAKARIRDHVRQMEVSNGQLQQQHQQLLSENKQLQLALKKVAPAGEVLRHERLVVSELIRVCESQESGLTASPADQLIEDAKNKSLMSSDSNDSSDNK